MSVCMCSLSTYLLFLCLPSPLFPSFRLFHIVVDTDRTASQILSTMNRSKMGGEVTFLPLNKLQPPNPRYPTSKVCWERWKGGRVTGSSFPSRILPPRIFKLLLSLPLPPLHLAPSPLFPFKTPPLACESLNAAIKRKVDHKETEWPQFNDAVKQYILGQRDNVLRSISGRGDYKIAQQYANLLVSPQQWTKMTPEQRKCAVKRFDSAKLKFTKTAEAGASSSAVTVGQQLSVSVENSSISALPFSVLEAIWKKAEEYLQSGVNVVSAPGGNSKDKMVASRSGTAPHFVQVNAHGQYSCDKQCLQWCSAHICSHTVVAAEVNGELRSFLDWYIRTKQEANITTLAQAGLPSGRGRKGGVPKRKRSRTPVASPEIVVPRSATSQPSAKYVCR